MAYRTRAQDAILSAHPGQQQMKTANTGSDHSWLPGDLVCSGSPTCETGRAWLPVLWQGDSASYSGGRGSLETSGH